MRALVRRRGLFDTIPNVDLCEISDITQTNWREALQGVDAIVHLAAIAHRGSPQNEADARRVQSVNVTAVAQLTAAAGSLGVRRLILLSSIGVPRTPRRIRRWSFASSVRPWCMDHMPPETSDA